MTLALPQGKCNAPDPSFGEHQGRDGGTAASRRARFQALCAA
jgi:hypothetical protein